MSKKKTRERLAVLEERLEELLRIVRSNGDAPPQSRTTDGEEPPKACSLPPVPEPVYDADLSPERLELLRRTSKKWVNGTRLHYCFLERATAGSWIPDEWVGDEEQKGVVRRAFETWKAQGIGLEFEEVQRSELAELRIGFLRGGSWSYVGRDAIDFASSPTERTINFGWDLTTPYGRDTALHEVGHGLGFSHAHQNPRAGIVWNEEAVLAEFRGWPNYWDDATIRRNILDKLPVTDVEGSSWDPDSIMQYEFSAGLIHFPERYQNQALVPEPGLSARDVEQAQLLYPPLPPELPELRPLDLKILAISPGEQENYSITPAQTREYVLRTFGEADSVLVLFEEEHGGLAYRDGDDDSGTERNAELRVVLQAGRRYVVRLRLFWASSEAQTALLMW